MTKSIATFDPDRESEYIKRFRTDHDDWEETSNTELAVIFEHEEWTILNVADDGMVETIS